MLIKPFPDQVDKRFQEWIFRHNAKRTTAFRLNRPNGCG